MIKTIHFELLGKQYEARQLSARDGFAFIEKDEHSTLEMVAGVSVVSGEGVQALDTNEKIDAEVRDVRGVVPAYKVLSIIYQKVIEINFGFMGSRRQMKVPRRFKAEITPEEVDSIHPTISLLIASGKATMAELETIYSVEDAIIMSDVLLADGINKALAHEHAQQQAKRQRH